ncbi:hypothetical protein G730_02399, partial [Escherichia coli HVH 59 (4-1119338)]
MSRSLRVYGGITKAANQQVAYIRITDHGLFAGDFVNFSNSGVTGVTGNMTVTTVIDKNTFTVTTQNTQDVDQNNEGRYWSFGTSFHSSPWRKTSLGTIPSFVDGSTLNRPGFPGECFICELRLPDHRFRWKHNKLFL